MTNNYHARFVRCWDFENEKYILVNLFKVDEIIRGKVNDDPADYILTNRGKLYLADDYNGGHIVNDAIVYL